MTPEFDRYILSYRDIINRVSRLSGEEYEYFIELRTGLMKQSMGRLFGTFNKLRILDYGCGTGTTEFFLKTAFPQAEILGVDVSHESIAVANDLHLDNVHFMVLEDAKLPFADNYFDVIYSNGTFHHIEKERHVAVFQELYRVLKGNGCIFIFENNPYNPLMMRAMSKNPFDMGIKALHPRQLKAALASVGFSLSEVSYYFYFPRILKFLRVMDRYLKRVPLGAQYYISATRND